MIIARPLSQARAPAGFDTTLSLLRTPDVTFGNLETSIIDIRDFKGAPYPFDGDWANVSQPSVGTDIRAMGFDMVGRSNNHALDWRLEGMRETGRRLNDAGIVHAGTGETRDLARAPAYLEMPKGRIAILSFATTFRPTSEAMPAGGGAPARPGISALHLTLRVHVTADAMKALAQATCVMGEAHCGNMPATLTLRGTTYVRGTRDFNEWLPDSEDMGEIVRSVREARQHADLVLVAEGRRMGSADGCHQRRPRRRHPDDRQHLRSRPPAGRDDKKGVQITVSVDPAAASRPRSTSSSMRVADRPHQRRHEYQASRGHRRQRPPAQLLHDRRTGQRLHWCRSAARRSAKGALASGRPWL